MIIGTPFFAVERSATSNVREQVKRYLRDASDEDLRRLFFDAEPIEGELVGLTSLSDNGVVASSLKMELQQYNPTAVVAILPGLDGQPGVAGVDDNGNGKVDDRSELGATHSDDRCETMRLAQAEATSPKPLILQRGAFVSVSSAQELLPDTELRVDVSLEANGEVSQFLIAGDFGLFQLASP